MDELNNSISLIENIYQISRPSILKLTEQFEFKEIPKGNVFVKKGMRNEKEYLLIKGICRSYVENPDGREVTLSFYKENTPISPNISRTSNYFSNVNIQALTDVKIAMFSTHHLTKLMVENREIRDWGNTVLQNELLQKVEKELSMATMSAKDRLIQFRKQYSLLENLVPHPHIASYLGITNISLSRLRNELMTNR